MGGRGGTKLSAGFRGRKASGNNLQVTPATTSQLFSLSQYVVIIQLVYYARCYLLFRQTQPIICYVIKDEFANILNCRTGPFLKAIVLLHVLYYQRFVKGD